MDIGTWWALVHGVTKSWTRLSNFHFHIVITSAWDLIYKTETDSDVEKRLEFAKWEGVEKRRIGRFAVENGKWKKGSLLSHIGLSATPWNITLQAPLSKVFSRQKSSHCSIPFYTRSYQHRDQTWVPWIADRSLSSEKFGVSRCKLLYTGRKKNKVQLQSTVGYTQYSIKAKWEKNLKKNRY